MTVCSCPNNKWIAYPLNGSAPRDQQVWTCPGCGEPTSEASAERLAELRDRIERRIGR
jgi:hypothetical protein